MPLTYKNRRGDIYYVLGGTTKTGKPTYFCSRKLDDRVVSEIPPGYEIYERPDNAIVTIRKVQTSRLLPAEATLLDELLGKLANTQHYIVDRQGDSFVIYTSDRDPEEVSFIMERLLGPQGRQSDLQQQWILQTCNYNPEFRLTLKDADKRLFGLERWCYRSRIDGWLTLTSGADSLRKLCTEYLPHLGSQSYFDLM